MLQTLLLAFPKSNDSALFQKYPRKGPFIELDVTLTTDLILLVAILLFSHHPNSWQSLLRCLGVQTPVKNLQGSQKSHHSWSAHAFQQPLCLWQPRLSSTLGGLNTEKMSVYANADDLCCGWLSVVVIVIVNHYGSQGHQESNCIPRDCSLHGNSCPQSYVGYMVAQMPKRTKIFALRNAIDGLIVVATLHLLLSLWAGMSKAPKSLEWVCALAAPSSSW